MVDPNAWGRIVGAVLFFSLFVASMTSAQETSITVHAREVLHKISPYTTGACIEDVNHEIYGGLYSQMVFGESFQEPAPGAAIAGFHAYDGDWDVAEGAATVSGGQGPKLILDSSDMTVGEVGVEVFLPDRATGPAGLILKVSEAGVGADRFNGYEIGLDAGRNLLVFGRHRQNWEPIRDTPCEVPAGRWIALRVILTETALEVYVDGKPILTYEDRGHPLRKGAVGLRAWQRPARFRNLWVQSDGRKREVAFNHAGESERVSGMWSPVRQGTAQGALTLETANAFVGRQSQRIAFQTGQGAIGVENRGLNRWGMAFVAGKPYEGALRVRCEQPADLTVALESGDGTTVYAEKRLHAQAGDWQRLDFTLTPRHSATGGRLAIMLKAPGSVLLGYVSLQPGAWGRYKGLPVRRDVMEGMLAGGLTVLRYGGSMVNTVEYRWKKMIGPRDRRPPYKGIWYPYASNGWGIPDFLDLCDAAGLLAIPAFNMDETPQDMADFIEYANGAADSEWGRKRVADGHLGPYHLKYIELGNEEAVDESYWERFEPMALAIWRKDPEIVLVVGDFAYGKPIVNPYAFEGAPNIHSLEAHKKILDLAQKHNREVYFDVHVWNQEPAEPGDLGGLPSFIRALNQLNSNARCKVVVFELNANKHGVQRGLATAHAVQALQRLGSVPIVCSANGLQPDGQNDNGWDQGLLFLSSGKVWGQPPYYAIQALSRNALPLCVRTQTSGATDGLDIIAKRSANGKILQLQAVNFTGSSISAHLRLDGFTPTKPTAQATVLTGELTDVNTAQSPKRIVPAISEWNYNLSDDEALYTFPANSFTILRFQ